MKLSELKGERAVEVIADLIEPITNIAMDQKNLKLFRAEKRDGETDKEMAVRDFSEKVPVLLKTHKQDILAILCSVSDVDPDELSVLDIIQGTMDLINDKDFLNLFLSAVKKGDEMQPTESSVNAENSKPE